VSEKFIEDNPECFNYPSTSFFQTLSEDFMRKHKDKLDWFYLCKNQRMSEEFVYEHLGYVSITIIMGSSSNDFHEYSETLRRILEFKFMR